MKHLIFYGDRISNLKYKLIEVNTTEYIKKRMQFWKWYKHETMGRPVLKLRRSWVDKVRDES